MHLHVLSYLHESVWAYTHKYMTALTSLERVSVKFIVICTVLLFCSLEEVGHT